MNQSVSINKILDFTPDELVETFGFEGRISERILYRVLERLGERQPPVIERYQQWISHQDLVDPMQFKDFSSSYFKGTHGPLGHYGHSRDGDFITLAEAAKELSSKGAKNTPFGP